MEASTEGGVDCAEMATELVASYVANNSVPIAELPGLIRSVHDALAGLGRPAADQKSVEPPKPAVPIKKSVFDDHIVCLENGKRFKSLKRHLATEHGMTPDEYRAKWGLPKDYPMVAPAYAKARSALARTMGLGRKVDAASPAPEPAPVPAPQPELKVDVAPKPAAAKPKRGRKAAA